MKQQQGQYRALNFSEVPQALGQQAIFAPIGSDADITDLDGRLDTLEGAPPAHSHAIADVTGLQTALDGKAAIGGALTLKTRAITGTISPNADDYLLLADASGGAVTVNLPAAATSAGRVLLCKKTDASANAVTLDGNGAETIDGAGTLATTTQYVSFSIACDGAAWWIV